MILILDSPYLLDHLYLKMAGNPEVVSVPLCEAFIRISGVLYDESKSTTSTLEFYSETDKKSYKLSRQQFMEFIVTDLNHGKARIFGFAIQPKGEMLTNTVKALIG